MLAERRDRVTEIDRDLGCGRTSCLKIAIPRDRACRVAQEELVRRVDLVCDRIGRTARHDEKEQRAHRSENAAAWCRASSWNARTRHRAALVDEPVGDEEDHRDAEEDLVPVLGAHSTLGRRGRGIDRAQCVGQALGGGLGVITEVAPTTVGRKPGQTRLVEAARDLRAVRVHQHLLELALRVVDRHRSTLRGTDTQREHVDVAREIRVERRQIRRGVLAVRDDDDRLCALVRVPRDRELRDRALQRRAQRRARVQVEAVARRVERRPHDLRVGGQRVSHDARAREEREPDPPTDELLADHLDRTLRRVQAIGLDVAHRHALGHVERDDRVGRRRGHAPRHLADLRPDQREHDEKARAADEDQLRDLTRGTRRRQARAGTGERGERAATIDERDHAECDDQDRRDQKRRHLGVRERGLHGVLRKTVAPSASSAKRIAMPSARKPRCASW